MYFVSKFGVIFNKLGFIVFVDNKFFIYSVYWILKIYIGINRLDGFVLSKSFIIIGFSCINCVKYIWRC